MDKIKHFNMELALFVKELHSFTANVNEIDDETTKLLIEIICAVDKLKATSKHCAAPSSSNENQFIYDLDEDIFKFRRYIVCCLCYEQIPFNPEDIKIHIQKISHKEKEKEIEQNSSCQSTNGNDTPQKIRNDLRRSTSCTVSCMENNDNVKQSISVNSMNSIGCPKSTVRANIEKTSSNSLVSLPLENIIKIDQVSVLIVKEWLDITTRNERRIQSEVQILRTLKKYLKSFDPKLKFITFGSSTYGFGGLGTNFNILVNAEKAEKGHALSMHEFNKFLKTPDVQNDFETLDKLSGTRVQKTRLQLLHKYSGILCWVQFGTDFELAETNQIIRDYIQHTPHCYHLIAYVRSWQNVLNEIAAKNGTIAFQLNTYIISVLVIFYLQMESNFPVVKSLPSSNCKTIEVAPNVNKERLKQNIVGFFRFYAKRYEINNHIISINIGGWQQRHLYTKSTPATLEQKKLRDGISSNAANWKDCSMYVQDIKYPGINIAAELSAREAQNFKKMCQMFTAAGSHQRCVDEFIQNLNIRLANVRIMGSNSSLNCSTAKNASHKMISVVGSSMQTLNNDYETINGNTSSKNLDNTASKYKIDIDKEIEKHLNFDLTYSLILDSELLEMLTRFDLKEKFSEITSTIAVYLEGFDSALKPIPFGSCQYLLYDSGSNFNLSIHTNNSNPTEVQHKFEDHLATTDFRKHFSEITKIPGYRVLKRQISMIHEKSGVQCILLFDNDKSIPDSTEIILRFTEKVPMLHSLIRFIRTWQNFLKEMYQNIVQFQFNTYLISVLVIFFFQMSYKIPVIEDIWSFPPISSNGELSVEKVACEFFSFYGFNYQIWNHVISPHIGQWQERQSPAEQRLRNGIKNNPASWINCTMCVQDIVRPDINIAAEIPKKAAENFQQMCRIFAKKMSEM